MTQVLVVVLGQACEGLQEATRPGGLLADGAGLALRRLPCDADAVAAMAVPPAFRLAWIFAGASLLGSAALRACHQRLAPIAPVTIALRVQPGAAPVAASGADFPGGVILQPYADAGFAPVLALITDFLAKRGAARQAPA